jgi:nucleotide-binding universal stress UspA family protein
MNRIVVGVDGSPQSRRALRWAAQEAKLRGAHRSGQGSPSPSSGYRPRSVQSFPLPSEAAAMQLTVPRTCPHVSASAMTCGQNRLFYAFSAAP